MEFDMDKLKKISKNSFKKQVKKLITKAALKYLLDKRKSKMERFNYTKLAMQPYFKSNIIKKAEAQNFFKFRTRMEDFSENFKNGGDSLPCPLCQQSNSLDNEQHFVKCQVISKNMTEILSVKEDELFTTNLPIDLVLIRIVIKALKKRKLLLESSN